MEKVIATGVQDFESLIVNQSFYVDKTDFIRKWWKGQDAVTLITRPRRFGKTLNMSTLNCFFSNKYENRGDLFEGLKVWEDADLRAQQGKWPVIFLSFAGIKQGTYELTRRSFNQLLVDLYTPYTWLLDKEIYTDADRNFFRSVRVEMTNDVAAVSIKKLCEWLHRYYGKKVLVLLDEYDTPLQEAYINGFWDDMVSYTRALFNSTFKTNPYMERGIMTGITRVSKESIFSDLNNLVVVTTTSGKYADCFGFTEEEVFHALDEQGFTEKDKLDVKRWYDGFTFGPVTDMYNPWSITRFLDEKKLDVYWANTSSNGLVGKLLRTGKTDIKKLFEDLMKGETIRVPVDEQIIFNQLDSNPAAIWSLLLASGYLKVVHTTSFREPDAYLTAQIYTLELTNYEVYLMFSTLIQLWFAQTGGLSDFTKAMLQGDPETMEEYMDDIMLATMSSFDGGMTTSEKVPESFYHGFVLGLLVEQKGRYEIRSNRESGYGRYDVMMIPREADMPAVILEFKLFSSKRGEKSLEDTAANALKQIEEKKYDTELLDQGIPAERILKYGFAFKGKECLIRKG